MRRSNMLKSWTSKQWMVALGISCGLLGFVLKLSGMPGSGESTAPAAPHGPSRAGRDASGPTGSRGEPAQVASGAGERGNEGGVWSDRAHADATPSGLKQVGPSDVGNEAGGYRLGHLTPRALRHLERIRGKKGLRSLRAATTDSATTASGPTNSDIGFTSRSGVQYTTASGPTNSDIGFTSGSGVQYTTDSRVEIGDIGQITGPAGTMSFWLQPESGAANQDAATLLQLGAGRIEVIENVNYLVFKFTDDGGITSGLGAPITDWEQGEWHQITTTWDGTEYALYVDGQLITQMSHDGFVDLPSGTKLYIGSNNPGRGSVAPGTIGHVDLRNRPLTPGEVANQFLASLGE